MTNASLNQAFREIDPSVNQENKALVLAYFKAVDAATEHSVADVLSTYTPSNYKWHGVFPFEEQTGAEAVAATFWQPLKAAWRYLQRRQDIFMAGESVFGGNWVCSTGHFFGTFERPWLGIPPTRKLSSLRYCEFHLIENGKIIETYLLADLLGVMKQAGVDPLPPQTAAEIMCAGPRTHDGLILKPQEPQESAKTLELIQRMARDLGEYKDVDMAASKLAETWHDDMMWYGPSGIGSTMGIDGFKKQHQIPFRKSLYSTRAFLGHKSCFAEGVYGGWIGWPSLSMKVTAGGYLGLPATHTPIDMRVVDIYRREGDKIAENWVWIDILYTLKQQDLDVFERLASLIS